MRCLAVCLFALALAPAARADTFTYSTDDPALMQKVLNAVAGAVGGQPAATPGAPGATATPAPSAAAGSTPPASTCDPKESVNGSTALAPGGPDGATSGPIIDCYGTVFTLRYVGAAKYSYLLINGVLQGNADQLRYIRHQVWLENHATKWVGVWEGGAFTKKDALPSPIPNGPVVKNPPLGTASPGGGGGSVTPVACTSMATLLTAATVTLPAGTYCPQDIPPLVTLLQGAGKGKTIVNGTGHSPAAGKACLDLQGARGTPPITIKDMTITGCTGTSVGCVREDGGRSFTIDSVECYGSSSGIGPTVDGDSVTIVNSYIHDNGSCVSEGSMHDIYVGPAPVFTLTNSIVGDKVGTGCNVVKSRALVSVLSGDTLNMNGMGHVDFPNGHSVTISNTTIVMPAPNAALSAGEMDTQMLSYCAEADGPVSDQVVTLKGVTFDSSAIAPHGVVVHLPQPTKCPNAQLNLSSGDVHWKGTAPVLNGWATVKGAMVQAQ